MLIISPGGDKDLLEPAKHIINSAPNLHQWEFYHYKPAKNWNYQLSTYEENGVIKILDVKEWKYTLYKFSDNTYDIIVKAKNINHLPIEEQNTIANIVLTNIIGEENYLNIINDVELVSEFNNEDKINSNPIEILANHIL